MHKPCNPEELVVLSVQKIEWDAYRDEWRSVVVVASKEKPSLDVVYAYDKINIADYPGDSARQLKLFPTSV